MCVCVQHVPFQNNTPTHENRTSMAKPTATNNADREQLQVQFILVEAKRDRTNRKFRSVVLPTKNVSLGGVCHFCGECFPNEIDMDAFLVSAAAAAAVTVVVVGVGVRVVCSGSLVFLIFSCLLCCRGCRTCSIPVPFRVVVRQHY